MNYICSNLDPIEESGSILSPSDISYDKTEEDFDTPRGPGRYKRPSAPMLDYEEDLTPPGKKSRRATVHQWFSLRLCTFSLSHTYFGLTCFGVNLFCFFLNLVCVFKHVLGLLYF